MNRKRLERELEEARRDVVVLTEALRLRADEADALRTSLAEARQERDHLTELSARRVLELNDMRRERDGFAAAAEEARQERDAAKDSGWDWMVKANERFARIAELEAERDAAIGKASAMHNMALSTGHYTADQELLVVRIQQLEAALRDTAEDEGEEG